jgi:choline dehydrogenase
VITANSASSRCRVRRPPRNFHHPPKAGRYSAVWNGRGAGGRIRLTGPHPVDPIEIETNFLSDPDDIKVAVACVEICREVGNSASMKQLAKRAVMPGNLRGAELENFIRNAASTYWHQTGTAKMGRDKMSVVDGTLKVYGIEGLRIADASVMPRITIGNTMAPCIIIGERAGQMLRSEHQLPAASPARLWPPAPAVPAE